LWRALRNDLLNLSKYVDAVFEQGRRLDVESRGAELVGVPKTWRKDRFYALCHAFRQ
jgi:hypothetical protein